MRFLVVEDDLAMRMALEFFFKELREDDELVLSAGVTTALDKLSTSSFDVAILDNKLQNDRYGGIKLRALIEEKYPHIKCAVVSVAPEGYDNVYSKPTDAETFRQLIKKLLPGTSGTRGGVARRRSD